ncbi:hypothetical protein [Desulfovibrio sp. JC022]|uniref:hypothetical protein n=1 Tax=Desulfovibrio sp. JC022 TaxID=2593642 RepID=UPI0013D40847|nr:hypothetical protein [Desulfovibrio sp. JC022]NDV21774.1 hypothetical protein [Desulfovibrio sp. JC022]
MTKSEVIKKQKEELDRFREVFALAVEGNDSDMVKDLKAKLDIMHKRHDMERKAWGITDTKKEGTAAKGAKKSRAISPELREKLDEVYGSGQRK